jgi:O-antigen ligase
MLQNLIRKTQTALAWFALVAALSAAVVVLGSYLVSASQPYRGPSLFYFYLLFFAALISRKWSTALLIFALPLLPDLAVQAEYILQPKVKYFVAYPGLDAIVGLFVGQAVRSVLIDRNLFTWLKPPPWPLGLALLVIAVSCWITIDRNLWQAASTFSWMGAATNIFRFKHVLYGNAFAPFNDFLVYSGAVLLLISLYQTLQVSKERDDLVFKPLIVGLIVSASWGLMQAMTGFGMPASAIAHRASTFGYGAFGFQPDIHAFAAHMLIGSVGLFGYMWLSLRTANRTLQSWWAVLVALACTASWIALILSKSRASLLFAMVIIIIWVGIYLRAQQKKILSKQFVSIVGVLTLSIIGLSFSENFWLADTLREFQAVNLGDFEVLNKISTYRLEIFRGALEMFAQFPLMGIGQGNFFHLSSNFDFMGSVWVAKAGGENAHNYFLQTLAELGLIGTLSFLVVFLWPVKHCDDFKKLVPVIVAIIAVFLGNLYSHSLIIRENLYLLAVFVALLYAHCGKAATAVSLTPSPSTEKLKPAVRVNTSSVSLRPTYTSISLLVCVIALAYFAYQEVSTAKSKFPLVYGSDCYRPTDAYADGWTSGRFVIPLADGKSGVKLTVDQNQADAKTRPVSILLTMLDQAGNTLHTVDYPEQASDQFSMQIAIPEAVKNKFQGGSVTMQLSKCFSPSNFGLKDDSRKLGVHLKSIEQF